MGKASSVKTAPARKSAKPFLRNVRRLVLAILLAAAGAMGKWVWEEYIQPKPLYVNIYVFDDATPRHELPGVAVQLYDLKDVEDQTTREFGRVRFQVPRKHRNEAVTPRFRLDGYRRTQGPSPDRIVLNAQEMSVDFTLTRIVPVQPQFEPKTYSSGGLPSGHSDQFSDWYTLCSDPEPAGWAIEGTPSFVLTGDRQCGAWAECRQTENSATKVCWQFRMQGHNEQVGGPFNHGNTGIQFSTGNLRVVWRH